MTATLNYQGHIYQDVGEVPCPMPGCEDGIIATQTDTGIPAYWDEGHLFVLNVEISVDHSDMNNLPNMP